MDFTILFNSGGNHGHKLKDALGGLTIGRLFDLNYVHTRIDYLNFFGIGYNYPRHRNWLRFLKYKKVQTISGKLMSGIDDYEAMCEHFKALSNIEKNTLVVFEKGLRIHPFQTIPWYKKGLIKKDIFSEIQTEISKNFNELHSLTINQLVFPINVAVHINRGVDYDKERFPRHFESPFQQRYMFPMDYFENIMEQIENVYGVSNVNFKIYTEKLNSQEILERFGTRPFTTLKIGSNRKEKNFDLIHQIFKEFVQADILVTCNSGFSAICSYFRKGKKTIYHPHRHLNYLPEPDYIKTTVSGDFNTELLLKV